MRVFIASFIAVLFSISMFGIDFAYCNDLEESIAAAGITNSKTIEALKKYKRYQKHKVFFLDPINKTDYSYAYRYGNIYDALKKGASYSPNYILFFKDNYCVWPQEYEQYMNSNIGKGRLLLYEGKYNEAIEQFKKVIEFDENDWLAYSYLGWTYYESGNESMALSVFEKYLSKNYNTSILFSKVKVQLKYNEFNEAQNTLKLVKGSLNKSQRSEHNYLLGICYAARGDYQAAVKLLAGRSILGIHYKLHDKGVKVLDIYQGGPAMLAGLQVGDVIVRYDNSTAKGISVSDFKKMVFDSPYGSISSIEFIRDGVLYEVKVVNGITADMVERMNKIKEKSPIRVINKSI